MRKFLLLLLALPIAVGCGNSPEQDAAELAASYIKDRYPLTQGYEAVNTSMDSLYNSILFNKNIGGFLRQCIDRENDLAYELERLDVAQDYYNRYLRLSPKFRDDVRISELAEEIEEHKSKSTLYKRLIAEYDSTFINQMKNMDATFWGWKVTHEYAYLNDVGLKEKDTIIFIMPKSADSMLWNKTFSKEEFEVSFAEMNEKLMRVKTKAEFEKRNSSTE